MQYQRTLGGARKRAEGGIITRHEFALIGKAGREAIISPPKSRLVVQNYGLKLGASYA